MKENTTHDVKLTNEIDLLALAEKMQEAIVFKPIVEPETPSTVMRTLKTIPFFSGLLQNLRGGGNAITSLLQIRADLLPVLQNISLGFHIGAVFLYGLDLFFILAVMLSAYILNKKAPITLKDKKSPFTLSSMAQLLLVIVSLTLMIISTALPVTALPIALAGAALGLVISVVTFANFLYQHRKINHAIKVEEKQLTILQEQAAMLVSSFNRADKDEDVNAQLTEKIKQLYQQFEAKRATIQDLYNQKNDQGDINVKVIFERFLGVFLGAVALAAVAVLFVAPPIGLGILAGVSFTGALYLVGSVCVPWLIVAGRKLLTLKTLQDNNIVVEQQSLAVDATPAHLTSPQIIYSALHTRERPHKAMLESFDVSHDMSDECHALEKIPPIPTCSNHDARQSEYLDDEEEQAEGERERQKNH